MSTHTTYTDTDAEETSGAEGRIDSFGIALPSDWVRVPVGEDFEAFVREQRARLAEDGRLSKTAQRQFELMLRQLRTDCQRANVSLAAAVFAIVEPGPDGEPTISTGNVASAEAELLCATCTLSSLERSAMDSELPLTVNTLAAALARVPDPENGIEVTSLEAPAIVAVPAGQSVKTVRLLTLPPTDATRERVALFTQHYFVPYDDGERSAMVSFASPTPEYARSFSSLFDAMMESFRMFGGDDPTDPLATPNSPSAEPQT